MTLTLLILVLAGGGLLAWLAEQVRPGASRIVSLAALAIDAVLVMGLWGSYNGAAAPGVWIAEQQTPWIPRFGISFHLAIDGLSLVLVTLSVFLGALAVLCSWTEIRERVGFFHFNLLWVLGGVIGVFLALDLFLFYFFWEMMLIPMYLLIINWGHEHRVYAGVKFFIFTQASGLLMLLSILGLYLLQGQATGVYSYDYQDLLGANIDPGIAKWLMLGFFIAFAVKLPMFPFHTWLPAAHTEAPTAGSVVLAGLLLKTGGYGLLRFVIPLFPEASRDLAPWAAGLGVVGVIYGAISAFGQTDLKKLVAYSSVSHMGFILLGVFAFNEIAYQGVVMQMVCHGVTTGALFIMVGLLYERLHTRDIARMGGLWTVAPHFGAVLIFFIMASVGLPGLGNFVGEFLTLLGAFQALPGATAIAALGLILGAAYSLRLVRLTLHGPNTHNWSIADLNGRETAILAVLAIAIIWLGVNPQPVIDAASASLQRVTSVYAGI
jgi:NADH-quinone oxidoreductase subunit M